jgi:hypothetical protein
MQTSAPYTHLSNTLAASLRTTLAWTFV